MLYSSASQYVFRSGHGMHTAVMHVTDSLASALDTEMVLQLLQKPET